MQVKEDNIEFLQKEILNLLKNEVFSSEKLNLLVEG